jgi:hemoglobin-like flavoprotein
MHDDAGARMSRGRRSDPQLAPRGAGTSDVVQADRTMTLEQQDLVRRSFADIACISDAVAALFLQRLFALDPAWRIPFNGDLTAQGRRFMTMMGRMVAYLDQPDAIPPIPHRTDDVRVGRGMIAAHYDTMTAAFLWTLQLGLGQDFTPATRDAWATCFITMSEEIQAVMA